MKVHVLLIGFRYFGKYLYNPSEYLVKEFDGREFEKFIVEGFVLPTSLRVVSEEVPRILRNVSPDIAIGIGLAPRANSVLLELVSANCLHFEIPDIEGRRVQLENVDPHELSIATTTLPIKRIVSKCSRICRLRPSLSIGTYICNATAYRIMKYASENGKLGGFIHVPPHTDLALRQGMTNYMSTYELKLGLECIIRESVEYFMDMRAQKCT